MSKLRNEDDKKKIAYWECDGLSPISPHPPASYWVEALAIQFDPNGAKMTTVDRVQELWLEDSEVYNLTDQWKQWMKEERYKRLPEPEVPTLSHS